MPKLGKNQGNMGQDFSMLLGSLFQQQKQDLWTKERNYWQQFLPQANTFSAAMMGLFLQKERPEQDFTDLLHKLSTPQEKRGQEVAARENDGIFIPRGKNDMAFSDEEVTSLSSVSSPAFLSSMVQKIMRSMGEKEGASFATETISSKIEQAAPSFITQQVQKYLYQTYLQKQEQHTHIVKETGSKFFSAEESMVPVGDRNLADRETGLPFVYEPLLGGQSFSAQPVQNMPDLLALLSGLQSNMMESFTELLQNMIPEVEDR